MKEQDYIKKLERLRTALKFIEGEISEIMGGLMAEVYKKAKKEPCTVISQQDNELQQLLN